MLSIIYHAAQFGASFMFRKAIHIRGCKWCGEHVARLFESTEIIVYLIILFKKIVYLKYGRSVDQIVNQIKVMPWWWFKAKEKGFIYL
jgi:hypothetical protein